MSGGTLRRTTHLVDTRWRESYKIKAAEIMRSRQLLNYCETRASESPQNKSCRNHAIATAFVKNKNK
jgi:hypothetical protein